MTLSPFTSCGREACSKRRLAHQACSRVFSITTAMQCSWVERVTCMHVPVTVSLSASESQRAAFGTDSCSLCCAVHHLIGHRAQPSRSQLALDSPALWHSLMQPEANISLVNLHRRCASAAVHPLAANFTHYLSVALPSGSWQRFLLSDLEASSLGFSWGPVAHRAAAPRFSFSE